MAVSTPDPEINCNTDASAAAASVTSEDPPTSQFATFLPKI
jgi:hypothetical protein